MARKPKPKPVESPSESEHFARDLAARIEDALSKLGVSQTELARRTGIVQPVIWKLIHGKLKRPKMEYVVRIARALDIPPEQFLPPMEGSQETQTSASRGPSVVSKVGGPAGVKDGARALEATGYGEQPIWPAGLKGFLDRNEDSERVTRRERWYLTESRFRAEPWVVFNDKFWLEMLHFWRRYLKEIDAEGEPPR